MKEIKEVEIGGRFKQIDKEGGERERGRVRERRERERERERERTMTKKKLLNY